MEFIDDIRLRIIDALASGILSIFIAAFASALIGFGVFSGSVFSGEAYMVLLTLAALPLVLTAVGLGLAVFGPGRSGSLVSSSNLQGSISSSTNRKRPQLESWCSAQYLSPGVRLSGPGHRCWSFSSSHEIGGLLAVVVFARSTIRPSEFQPTGETIQFLGLIYVIRWVINRYAIRVTDRCSCSFVCDGRLCQRKISADGVHG